MSSCLCEGLSSCLHEGLSSCPCELIHGAARHSVCKKLSCALVYNRSVRTAKTVSPMVRTCPFASLVPIIGGLVIGGHRTPFSSLHRRWIIGSEHQIQQ